MISDKIQICPEQAQHLLQQATIFRQRPDPADSLTAQIASDFPVFSSPRERHQQQRCEKQDNLTAQIASDFAVFSSPRARNASICRRNEIEHRSEGMRRPKE